MNLYMRRCCRLNVAFTGQLSVVLFQLLVLLLVTVIGPFINYVTLIREL